MCECHIFMCGECSDAYEPFSEPSIGILGIRKCRRCGKVVDCWNQEGYHLVPVDRIVEVDPQAAVESWIEVTPRAPVAQWNPRRTRPPSLSNSMRSFGATEAIVEGFQPPSGTDDIAFHVTAVRAEGGTWSCIDRNVEEATWKMRMHLKYSGSQYENVLPAKQCEVLQTDTGLVWLLTGIRSREEQAAPVVEGQTQQI